MTAPAPTGSTPDLYAGAHRSFVSHLVAPAPAVGGLSVIFGPDGAGTRILEGVGVWLATLAIQWAFSWVRRRIIRRQS